ncbi:MAG: FliG C-terminal domain-containing protein [Pseudomonadota bacterium]
MTLPAPTRSPGRSSRSAALMKALGSDADAVWDLLSPDETDRLRADMQSIDADKETAGIGDAFLKDMARDQDTTKTSGSLSTLGTNQLNAILTFLNQESPQVTALVLSILPEHTAAATLQNLPKQTAVQALHRLMRMDTLHPSALTAVETAFAARTQASSVQSSGPDRLAGIMNVVDSTNAADLMASLDEIEPGSADRVKALMFTFDDLATLDPGSLQTLLANTDRALLIIALQNANTRTADAFYRNMTTRAGDVLRSEIESSGPFRRAEIEEARREIAKTARKLARRGDLLSASKPDQDLIE